MILNEEQVNELEKEFREVPGDTGVSLPLALVVVKIPSLIETLRHYQAEAKSAYARGVMDGERNVVAMHNAILGEIEDVTSTIESEWIAECNSISMGDKQ